MLNNQLDPNPLLYSNFMNAIKNNSAFSGLNIDNNLVATLRNNINGTVIKDLSDGKIYRAEVRFTTTDGQLSFNTSDPVYTYGRAYINTTTNTAYGNSVITFDENDSSSDQFDVYYDIVKWYIVLREETAGVVSIPNSRKHLIDGTYDMVCMPYSDDLNISLINNSQTVTIRSNKELAINTMQSLALAGGSNVYDVQILPYCPCREYINSVDRNIDLTGSVLSKDYVIITDQSATPAVLGVMMFCSNCQQDDIILLNKNDNYQPYSTPVNNIKKEYNTRIYRLSSPNFAASFEFNPAMNRGVECYLASYTYKPFNPYIRVRPQFKGMYGNNFQDGRGLILQGDFSIATMTDKWVEFEIQNKNYLNTFNREIDTLELQNKIGREEDIAKAITGIFTGAASGAMTGAVASGGNPYAAIAGAAVGGIASGVTGVIDLENNRKLRNDAIDKAKTLFEHNLQNIKALPNTIRNIGCLTNDFTLVPVLEMYEASDSELEAFDRKMEYYGMSVMKQGQIFEFLNPNGETFIKGDLIRLLPPEGIIEESDNHFAETLSAEVQKGIYIGG